MATMYERWASDPSDSWIVEDPDLKDPAVREAVCQILAAEQRRNAKPGALPEPREQRRVRETTRLVQRFAIARSDYPHWDHLINEHTLAFKKTKGIWPNVLVASPTTYRAIELVANQTENMSGTDGERPTEGDFVSFSVFECRDYELELCVDDSLEEGAFLLDLDDDGGGGDGGERVPEDGLRRNWS